MKQVINLESITYTSPMNELFCFFYDLEALLIKCGYEVDAFIAQSMGKAFHPTEAITFEKVLCYRLTDIQEVLDHLCWDYGKINIKELTIIHE